MGCTSVKETYISNCKDSNIEAKYIELVATLFSGWGFDYTASSVKNFADYLSNKGYNVKVIIKSVFGFGWEFDIEQVDSNGRKKYIFSNKSKNSQAVISSDLTKKIYEDIISKIEV